MAELGEGCYEVCYSKCHEKRVGEDAGVEGGGVVCADVGLSQEGESMETGKVIWDEPTESESKASASEL